MKGYLTDIALTIVTIALFSVLFSAFPCLGATCTKGTYNLNVSGNANGPIQIARDSCDGSPVRMWFEGYSVAGDGGGTYSGVEAILPGRLPPLEYFPPHVGDTWQRQDSEILPDKTVYPTTLIGTVTSVGETVSVISGTFTNCAKVEETVLYPKGVPAGYGLWTAKSERWFAPGVGPVKLSDYGPRWTLVYGGTYFLFRHHRRRGRLLPTGIELHVDIRDERREVSHVERKQCPVRGRIWSGPPAKGDYIPSGSNYTVIWGTPPEVTRIGLKYSLDNGATWKSLSNNDTGSNYI